MKFLDLKFTQKIFVLEVEEMLLKIRLVDLKKKIEEDEERMHKLEKELREKLEG